MYWGIPTQCADARPPYDAPRNFFGAIKSARSERATRYIAVITLLMVYGHMVITPRYGLSALPPTQFLQARPESMIARESKPVEFERALFWLILVLNVAHLRNGDAVAGRVYGDPCQYWFDGGNPVMWGFHAVLKLAIMRRGAASPILAAFGKPHTSERISQDAPLIIILLRIGLPTPPI